jgi:hypothetical protein
LIEDSDEKELYLTDDFAGTAIYGQWSLKRARSNRKYLPLQVMGYMKYVSERTRAS